MHRPNRFPRRRALALAAVSLSLGACLGNETTGTITDVYAQALIFGTVTGPDGAPVPNAEIEVFQYPIDRGVLEAGSCIGPLTAGPTTTANAQGRYRVIVDGFANVGGSGCLRLIATADESAALAEGLVERATVPYLLTIRDSIRIDVSLPAADQ
jgi:hypothetical protein